VFQFFKSKAFPKLKKLFAKLSAEHTAESCSTLTVNLPIPSLLIKNWNTGTNSCFPVRNQCFALFQWQTTSGTKMAFSGTRMQNWNKIPLISGKP